jgi:CrcB protein
MVHCHARNEEISLKELISQIMSGLCLFLTNKTVAILLGGAVGTYARYGLGKWISSQAWAQGFPFATLIINVSGSFVLGVAGVIIFERLEPEHQDLFLLIGTGFCGGFTTFSTFEWETFKLMRDGSRWLALANVVGSVVAGFVAVWLAVSVTSALFPPRR